ncbi:hypothetical protein ACJX0J_020116, partial [Zea mays]
PRFPCSCYARTSTRIADSANVIVAKNIGEVTIKQVMELVVNKYFIASKIFIKIIYVIHYFSIVGCCIFLVKLFFFHTMFVASYVGIQAHLSIVSIDAMCFCFVDIAHILFSWFCFMFFITFFMVTHVQQCAIFIDPIYVRQKFHHPCCNFDQIYPLFVCLILLAVVRIYIILLLFHISFYILFFIKYPIGKLDVVLKRTSVIFAKDALMIVILVSSPFILISSDIYKIQGY